MRKPRGRAPSDGGEHRVSLPEPDARAGRVGGAQVAFGAPGPRVDLDRVLQSWRDGPTVEGAAQDRPAAAAPAMPRRICLSDGTTISFDVALAQRTEP
jgi:hypothetical protein